MVKVKADPIKRCLDCALYPKRCGYWDERYRKANLLASFLQADARHNCQDFAGKTEEVKGNGNC